MSCPICGFKETEKIAEKSSYKLVQCKFCKHAFIQPLPTKEEIRDGYLNKTAFAPHEDYFVFLESTSKKYGVTTAEHILSYLDRLRGPGRLLDFGCGAGTLIRCAMDKAWDSYGIDIGPWAKRAADEYDLRIFVGDVENTPFNKESFDAITMIDVLEHLNNPVKKARGCMTLLKKGGIVVIQVPNISCIHARLLTKRWGLFTPPGHIHYFSKDSVRLFFETLNIECLSIQTRFVSGFGILGIKWLNPIIQPSLNLIKLGDLIVAFGRKRKI